MKIVIRKIGLLFILLFVMILSFCKKDSGGASSNFLEVTIDGKTYRDERPIEPGYGSYVGDFCSSKPNNGWNIMEIDLSTIFISADLACYEDNADFQKSAPGSYSIDDGIFFINPCNSNLDIVLTINDNTITQDTKLMLQSSNRVHSVTTIKQYALSNTDVEYIVAGTFSCSFKNVLNKTYSVSGKYQTSISVRK